MLIPRSRLGRVDQRIIVRTVRPPAPVHIICHLSVRDHAARVIRDTVSLSDNKCPQRRLSIPLPRLAGTVPSDKTGGPEFRLVYAVFNPINLIFAGRTAAHDLDVMRSVVSRDFPERPGLRGGIVCGVGLNICSVYSFSARDGYASRFAVRLDLIFVCIFIPENMPFLRIGSTHHVLHDICPARAAASPQMHPPHRIHIHHRVEPVTGADDGEALSV